MNCASKRVVSLDSYEMVFSLEEELLSAEFRCVASIQSRNSCLHPTLSFSPLCICLFSTVHPLIFFSPLCSVQCAMCIHLSAPPEYISLLVCWPPTTSPYQQSSSFADAPNSQSNVGSLQQVSQIIRNQTNRRTDRAHIPILSTTNVPAKVLRDQTFVSLFPGRR